MTARLTPFWIVSWAQLYDDGWGTNAQARPAYALAEKFANALRINKERRRDIQITGPFYVRLPE